MLAGATAPATPSGVATAQPHASRPADPLRVVLARDAPPLVAEAYRARGYPLLWIAEGRLRPEAGMLLRRLEGARDDGLDPEVFGPAGLRRAMARAASGEPADLARAELALSVTAADFIAALHRPSREAAMAFWDPALPHPPATPQSALASLFGAHDLGQGLSAALRMHPIYDGLRAELRRRPADDPRRPLILANLDRARALPADLGARHVIVDAAAQRLWLYEDGKVADSMRVIVGKRGDPTPSLAGLIRYANYRPYWNVPVDVVSEEIAPRVLREGTSYLAREQMEVLSDWTARARVVDAAGVDWKAVAAGEPLRVRRRPGAYNVLGEVKLMLPNPLGIYLHDTPDKQPFGREKRTLSHGCIRLEAAQRLARRLIGPAAGHPPPGDDARVDLPTPVPLYVVYFTLAPGPSGLERRPDIYGRDAAVAGRSAASLAVAD